MSVYVVRAFVQLREVLATHKDLAAKLATLERQTQALALKHDTLAQNTRLQLKQVFEAIQLPISKRTRCCASIHPSTAGSSNVSVWLAVSSLALIPIGIVNLSGMCPNE